MKYAATLALCLLASPAFADAVTYYGTLDSKSIVVEFSEQPTAGNAELFGRYFYADQGIDIPLHAATAARSRLGLAEEVPCSEEKKNCSHAEDDTPSDPPLGAKWELEIINDGNQLKGKWSSGGRNRPVSLLRTASRPFDPAGGLSTMADFASSLLYSGAVLTAETSPYDYLKMANFVDEQGPRQTLNGNDFRYNVDPRTKFQFPYVVDIGGEDTVPANTYLEQRHWMMSLDALWCASQQYQGFGWNGYNFDAGSLGYWDEEQVEVHYLSPTVMTWTESGSLSCGGAHPYNHHEFHNLDVRSGEPLDLSRIFKDWVFRGDAADLEDARDNPENYQWGPGAELMAFVDAHRLSNDELGFTDPDGCPIDELIPEYLAIGFKGDDTVLFSMDGMPHVSSACASDLYEAPITELRELLTPEAADYFPVLAE